MTRRPVENPLHLCGYVIPFNRCAMVNGAREWVTRGAFKPTARNIGLLFAEHVWDDAEEFAVTKDGSLAFWADAYGLAFEAHLKLRPGVEGLVCAVRNHFTDGVSIGFDGLYGAEAYDAAGKFREINSATIDHITVTEAPAFGTATGIWHAERGPQDLPQHLAALARHWHSGLNDRTMIAGLGVTSTPKQQTISAGASPTAAQRGRPLAVRPARRSGGAAARRAPVLPASLVRMMADSRWLQSAADQKRILSMMERNVSGGLGR